MKLTNDLSWQVALAASSVIQSICTRAIFNHMKYQMLLFITYSANHNEILHMSQQCNCCGMCKTSKPLWCVQNFVVTGWLCLKPELSKFLLDFEFDRNNVSGMDAWDGINHKIGIQLSKLELKLKLIYFT